MASFQSLSDFDLLLVFDLLNYIDKHRLQRVCSRWAGLCSRAIKSHKKLGLEYHSTSRICSHFELIDGHEVRRISPTGLTRVSSLILQVLAQRPNLKELNLIEIPLLESLLKELPTLCPKINSFSLRSESNVLKSLGDHFPLMARIHLDLNIARNDVTEDLKYFLRKTERLERVSLSFRGSFEPLRLLPETVKAITIHRLNDDEKGLVQALLGSQVREALRTLALLNGCLSFSSLSKICERFKHLRQLNIGVFQDFCKTRFEPIGLLKTLTDLTLCWYFSRVIFDDSDMKAILVGCRQTARLDLRMSGYLSDHSIVDINLLVPRLKYLSCPLSISDCGLTSLSRLGLLQKMDIELSVEAKITEDGILEVLSSCQRLRELTIQFEGIDPRVMFTSKSVLAVAQKAHDNPRSTFELTCHRTFGGCFDKSRHQLPENLRVCLSNDYWNHVIIHPPAFGLRNICFYFANKFV